MREKNVISIITKQPPYSLLLLCGDDLAIPDILRVCQILLVMKTASQQATLDGFKAYLTSCQVILLKRSCQMDKK